MTVLARWSFPIASTAAAFATVFAIQACGTGAGLSDRSQNASSAAAAPPAGVQKAAPPGAEAKDDDDRDEAKIRIKTLSNRADLISGGDALVEIVLSKAKLASSLRVQLNGR